MKILKLNELDILILKTLIKKDSSIGMLKFELNEYNFKYHKFKNITYQYLWTRVNFLNNIGLIKVGFTKPKILSIPHNKLKLISSYLSSMFSLEKVIDGEENV